MADENPPTHPQPVYVPPPPRPAPVKPPAAQITAEHAESIIAQLAAHEQRLAALEAGGAQVAELHHKVQALNTLMNTPTNLPAPQGQGPPP